jgi:transcriptional regulator with XRE-family HTH domain/tetratricopeptide (TPR) repeat protein
MDLKEKHPLRVIREQQDLSIDDLAEEAGLSRKTIIRAEQGHFINPSSRRVLRSYFSKQLGYAVTSQDLGLLTARQETLIEEETPARESVEPDMDEKRRKLILAGASMMLIPGDIFHSELWDRMGSALMKPTYIDEQTLSQIERLNEVCFSLSNNNQLEMVEQILPTYLPHITAFAQQSSNSQQARAAGLASRGFILAAEIDKKNVPAMETYTQQAVFYSQFSHDSNIQVDALRVEATIALVAKQPLKALLTYQKALPLMHQVSPLLRSRVYLGLASASARCGQKQDALRYLGLAQEHFPAQPEADPNFQYLYMSASRPALHLYEALTFSDLKQPKDAWNALMQVNGVQPKMPVTESTRIEFINLQAKTAAMLGNMEESCTYLQAGVDAADAAGYSIWREEATEIYQDLVRIWPHELQIRRLGSLLNQKGA